MIPRIIHRIWIGDGEIPDYCKKFGEQWEAIHPSWQYILWDNEKVAELHCDAVIQAMNGSIFDGAQISNYLRFVILSRFGGVYADIDVMPIKPLDTILDGDYDVAFGRLHPNMVGVKQASDTNVVMATQGAPQLMNLLESYPKDFPRGDFTAKWLSQQDGVYLFNYEVFQDIKQTPNSYTLHWPHRLASWVPKRTPATDAHHK